MSTQVSSGMLTQGLPGLRNLRNIQEPWLDKAELDFIIYISTLFHLNQNVLDNN